MKKSSMLSLKQLKGVGPKREELLNEKGIFSLRDLLFFFPSRYDFVQSGESKVPWSHGLIIEATGIVTQVQHYYSKRRMSTLKVTLIVSGQMVSLYWFNQGFLKNRFQVGDELSFQGKLSQKGTFWNVSHPKLVTQEKKTESDSFIRCIPVYRQSESWFVLLIDQALEKEQISEIFSEEFVKKRKLMSRTKAIQEIHRPTSTENLEQARYRFAFEELLFFQAILMKRRYLNEQTRGVGIKHEPCVFGGIVASLLCRLPFALTSGQERSWREIQMDMEDTRPMQRLLQGDVGSGKTILATLGLAKTVENGMQGALMVPTEILAQQHFENLCASFANLPVNVELLTHSTSSKDRNRILSDLKKGEIDIIIGTHALIQEHVQFSSLGLVVADEQHRFGVNQRDLLYQKGSHPDLLVMTATPIPRTLALTFYGDLDISTIDTMPVGRRKIRTFLRTTPESRKKVYQFAYDEVKKGRQIYVVAPAIEDNPEFILKSVEELYEELNGLWNDEVRVGYLHGRMNGQEKQEIMEQFLNNRIHVLVATTVIEVGIHVPNATVMIIENAERFGLSQLHQLRGRIGRGEFSSYCILLSTAEENERLSAMERISDGFLLAEEDLRIRGPGEFFGEKQHGLPDLKITELLLNVDLLKETRGLAEEILAIPERWQAFHEEMNYRFSKWLENIKQH
jgi:RecG-like helicase